MCLRNFLIVVTSLFGYGLHAQYPITDIPKELFENANAVIRLDEATYEVTSSSSGKYKRKRVVTILNEEAEWLSGAVVGYDKLSRARIISGNAYDALGRQLYKLKRSDIQDQSSISGFSVYEDNRIKYLDLAQAEYPYTIEYEYEVDYNFLYFIPNWYTIPGQFISVQKSTYHVISPESLKPRYKNLNFGEENFSGKKMNGKLYYNWDFENLKAVRREPYGPGITELVPIIYVAPSQFEFEGYRGNMSTWDGIAEWQKVLNKGRDALPQETVDKIANLVAPLDNDRDKIKAVYEYLQSNTRYVSIQLGIGGFQPFEAKTVDELGYGDCKALSFYTQSLLRSIGIEALYTWVEADDNPRPLFPDFANDTFNHIILCVPNKGDTVWLECTSQTNPFGYLGSFTGDRDVLLITDQGGKIVHTPVYDHATNLQSRNVTVQLSEDGSAEITAETSYGGLKYEHEDLHFVLEKGEQDKKQWVIDNTDLPNFDLSSYKIAVDKGPIPEASIQAEYSLAKYAKPTGKRLFFEVNPMNRVERLPRAVEDRKSDFIQNQSFTEVDSVKFLFEEKFKVEYAPEGVQIESKFGEYESSLIQEAGQMTFVRKFVLKKGRYPAEDYEEYRVFLNQVIKADAGKIVLNGAT